MTLPTPPASGVYTPVPTFMKPAGANGRFAIDVETQVKHTVFLAENGIKGVVLLGSTGEMIHLNAEERFDFVSGVKKGIAAAGHADFPILAGVAHNGIDDTIAEVASMKKAGASYAMVLAPNYFAGASTQNGIIAWFTAVAEESVLPVVIYYYPGVSNNLVITPSTLVKLAAHPNIVGIKMSHGNVSDYIQLALNPDVQNGNFLSMTGLGQVLLPAVTAGITATIDAISGAYPKSLVKLLELSLAGKIKEAQKIQYVVSCAEEIVAAHGPVGAKYAISKALGYGKAGEQCRPPLSDTLTVEQASKFEPALKALAALEASL